MGILRLLHLIQRSLRELQIIARTRDLNGFPQMSESDLVCL